ncbi:ABC transporter ATP-binding protein [Frankia sp. CNm7]|uniref:ABC transporter ATP-binding protein n=1 Tax=Frankia nepalensis TaxID=1836974 RepID=A0A937RLS9_9ACTN|nr:ABC transporter ATP-binding protein [Frankia nepalensis]MBL7496106.1 ABC transporter ATP-binding protein [Frankia nepalensis]MBL7508955.1 ABC transporter ATP-binding protein [Frankia nepalensis]MBL7516795.1 ABC transporter ATP-binding protein [Frankia nepalensis]MBL7628733.1 ABC transporter ATP-binding protein [Frankia nepalensis]
MIEARGLTKRYGRTLAVNDLSFTVQPGRVTGFLGPNGAGKSTTMRMILGLDRPTAGDVRIDGKRYADLKEPLRHVGALLDARWVHPNRSARAHLRWLAVSNRLPEKRVGEVLELVGLTQVAGRRAGGYSLGMSQRLGIAGALLGDPGVLLFDEPVNGLDPEGILWIRQFMHRLAAEGRTVFVSSHLLSEMALTAQDLVVIGRGRLISQTSTSAFIEAASGSTVRVRGPELGRLREVIVAGGLAADDAPASDEGPAALVVHGATTDAVGELAGRAGLVLHELAAQRGSLEQAFIQMTGGDVEYRTGTPVGVAAPAGGPVMAVPGQPAGAGILSGAAPAGKGEPR